MQNSQPHGKMYLKSMQPFSCWLHKVEGKCARKEETSMHPLAAHLTMSNPDPLSKTFHLTR